MKRVSLPALAAVLLLHLAAPLGAQKALVYDAANHTFLTRQMDIDWEESVVLQIENRLCGVRYSFTSETVEIPPVEATVRGEFGAAPLLVPGIPVGFGAPSSVPADKLARSVADMVKTMLSGAAGVADVKAELDDEWRIIEAASDELQSPVFDRLETRLCHFTQQGACAGFGHPTPARVFETITGDSSRIAGSLQNPPSTTCPDLRRIVDEVNDTVSLAQQAELEVTQLDADKLVQDFQQTVGQQARQLMDFEGKVRRALEAVAQVERLLKVELRSDDLQRSVEQMRRYQDLSNELKTGLGPGALFGLLQRTGAEVADIQRLLGELENDYKLSQPTRYKQKLTDLSTKSAELSALRDDLDRGRTLARHQVGSMLTALRSGADSYRETLRKDVKTIPGGKNQRVTVHAHEQRRVVVPDATQLLRVQIAAAGATPTVSGAAPDAATSVVVSDPLETLDTASVMFRQTHLINIGGAIVYSGLESPGFDLRDAPDGSGDKVMVQTSRSEESVEAALFVSLFYPKRLDLSSPDRARELRFGPALGFGFSDPLDNIYVGGFVQPMVGVQILAGLHFGTIAKPKDDIVPGETVVPDVATSLAEERDTAIFLSVGFDIGIFRSLFGPKPAS